MASGYSSTVSSSSSKSSSDDEDEVLVCPKRHTIYHNRKEEITNQSDCKETLNDDREDGELVDEPTDQTDAARETDAVYEDDWYTRRYLFSHRPEMKNFYARMLTYARWPLQMRQRPRELTQAGFYYTGNHDAVTCYCCGLQVYRWKKNDDPVMEHYRLSPRCPYVIKVFRH